ncbi:UDP-N-acetylmuramoyl-L-alanine--D-glutamate ligase [soil metagenome]
MNTELSFTGKQIVILGLARQGLALARFFVGEGAHVVVSDMASADKLQSELSALADLPVEFVLGGHPLTLLDNCDLLCLSGGVPPQLEIVQSAIARGIRLSNDSLLTIQRARQFGLGPIIAITGSSGKTTTTTLVGLMLAESGKRVHVGGNIGTPLLDRMHLIKKDDCIVLELSSFQLELFDPQISAGVVEHCGPDVVAILNITPNHLDRHPNMLAYAAAKLNLLHHLPENAQVVVSADDPVTQRLASKPQSPASPLPAAWALDGLLTESCARLANFQTPPMAFSRQTRLSHGAWLEGETLVYNQQAICQRAEIHLRGDHNISNMLAAAAISGAAGATVAAMGQVARTFMGVPHRLEVVLEADGVTWLNDSIATSPERAIAALRSFTPGAQTLVLLVGGKDKNLPWEIFANEALDRVNFLIGFGHAGPMIINLVQERARYNKQQAPNCAVVQRLDEAVELAARVALLNPVTNGAKGVALRDMGSVAQQALSHTVVLLSPGGTSYDAYRDFEARGEHFRQLVTKWAHLQVTA